MKHIIHVNFASGFGGGEVQTTNLIKSLSKQGFSQTVVLKRGKPFEMMIDNAHLENIQKVYVKNLFSSLFSSELRKIKGDVIIHAHDGRGVHWAALFHRIWNTPYLITRRVENKISSNWLTEKNYNTSAALVAISNVVQSNLVNQFNHPRIIRIPDTYSTFSVNNINVNKLKSRFKNSFVVGQVSSLIALKGHRITLAVARELNVSHPHIQFLILGDGKEKDELLEISKDLDNVVFEGHKDNVGDYLSIFDILVHPSYKEGLGSILLEAQQFSIPVVATNVGGIPDVVQDKKTGLLIASDNPEELKQAILKLYQDEQLCKNLIEGAKKQLPIFSNDSVTNQYVDLYNEIG